MYHPLLSVYLAYSLPGPVLSKINATTGKRVAIFRTQLWALDVSVVKPWDTAMGLVSFTLTKSEAKTVTWLLRFIENIAQLCVSIILL